MSFQLKPNKKETENKTIRFPIAMIEKIEAAKKTLLRFSQGSNRSCNKESRCDLFRLRFAGL